MSPKQRPPTTDASSPRLVTPPAKGLRLMVYDRGCRGRRGLPGLSHAWWAGAQLYRGLRRFDGYQGVDSWAQALDYIANFRSDRPLAEVQYWGHGKWGAAKVGTEVFDRRALDRDHPLHDRLAAVRDRFEADEPGLWWFRTCETLGATAGHRFSTELADFLGTRVAGHTYIIGHVQSGLHSVAPGQQPDWSATEGLREGSPDAPRRAHWSRLREPNTITCLRGSLPKGY